MGNFVDVSNEEIKAALTFAVLVLSPLMAFISWFVFAVILSVVLKLKIKLEEVSADIKNGMMICTVT